MCDVDICLHLFILNLFIGRIKMVSDYFRYGL